MTNRPFKLVVVLLLAGILVIAPAAGALAACHRFDLKVSDASPDEGDSLNVTVSRDGAVEDSGVRVAAVNGTARAGSDFTAFDQQVNFTGDSTERSFLISIIADGTAEPAERPIPGWRLSGRSPDRPDRSWY